MIEVRSLNIIDMERVADLHYHSFKGFFLTSLGKLFLKIFYNAVIKHKNGFGLGAFDSDNNLLGFAIGTSNSSGFYRSILKDNGLKMIKASFNQLMLKPNNLIQLLRSLLSFSKVEYNDIPTLLSICVSDKFESKGIGRKLLIAFEDNLKLKGFTELILTTDAHNNEYVNQFYLRNDYRLDLSFLQGKRKMNLYYKKI